MTREIKFRGKNGVSWFKGDLEYCKKVGIACIHTYRNDGVYDRSYQVNPQTVGQFTGLHDKKGKEIYEGDIFHIGDESILYQVIWHDTGLIGKQIHASCYAGLEHWKEKILVIGNIYDNPELLNRE